MRRFAIFILISALLSLTVGCDRGESEAELDRYAAAARIFNNSEIGLSMSSLADRTAALANFSTAEDGSEDVTIILYFPDIGTMLRYQFDPQAPVIPGDLGQSDISGFDPPAQWNASFDVDGRLIVENREAESLPSESTPSSWDESGW